MIISQYSSAFAMTYEVRFAEGSSIPGCEKTNSCFLPSTITITKGDTVNFYNADSQTHIVTSGSPSTGYDGRFQPVVKIGHTQPIRFDNPGVIPYYCEIHPWTVGKVIVNDIKINSINLKVSPSTIFDGERATLSGQVFASAPIARNTLVYEHVSNTGITGSGWVDEGGSFSMNVIWPVGTHTVTVNIRDYEKIISNPIVLDIKSKEPPKTIITLDPMRDYGSTTDGLAEFTGKLTTQDGTPLSGKKVSVKFEKQGSVATEFDYTDPSGRYSVVYGFNNKEGDWKVYTLYEDGVKYQAAQSNKLIFTVYPDPESIPTKTPESEKPTSSTPQVTSSSATINVQMIKSYYNQGDIITIYGTISKNTGNLVSILVTDPNDNLMSVQQVKVDSANNFAVKIQTGSSAWGTSGTYAVKAQYGASIDKEYFQYQANKLAPKVSSSDTIRFPGTTYEIPYTINGANIESVVPDRGANSIRISLSSSSDGELTITLPRWMIDAVGPDSKEDSFFVLVDGGEQQYKETKSSDKRTLTISFPHGVEEIEIIGSFVYPDTYVESNPYSTNPPPSSSTTTSTSTPSGTDITIPSGTGVPGCEESNSCFLPSTKSVSLGKTVTWYNADSAAHTVTSGVVTEANSIGKVFDTGLFLAGATFSHKFTSAGNFPYFCMVHPWMVGQVNVIGSSSSSSSSSSQTSNTLTSTKSSNDLGSPGKLKVPIVVYTDNPSYSAIDKMKVFGQVKNKLKDYPVTLQIFDPNKKLKTTQYLDVDKNQSFEAEFTDLGNLGKTSGKYTIRVFYGTEINNAETSFEFKRCSDSNSLPLWSGQLGKAPTDLCKIPTSITLDSIPSSIYVSKNAVFSGKLTTSGIPVPGASVIIKADEPHLPDQFIVQGITDSNGKFTIPWTASSYFYKKDFKIYAVFEGDSVYENNQSPKQIMLVQKHGGSLVLDTTMPASANIGDSFIFSGTLTLENVNPANKVVYIKDEDPLDKDDLLVTAAVGADGRFSANWFVKNVDFDKVADIYAVYEAEDASARITSCDEQPTSDLGGSCKTTKPLKINPTTPPPNISPPSTPPSSQFPPDDDGYRWNGDEYLELKYVQPYNDRVHVGIVPSPDSYTDTVRYVYAVQEGVLQWTSMLEKKSGSSWDVTFEVLTRGQSDWKKTPDIIINIVSHEEDEGCQTDYYGWTYRYQQVGSHNAYVCITSNKQPRTFEEVAATTGHEFIHSVGLGHAWNKPGDLMCSGEMKNGNYVYTCPPMPYGQTKSKFPSGFDTAAASYLYANNGWSLPNNDQIRFGDKFTVYDYLK